MAFRPIKPEYILYVPQHIIDKLPNQDANKVPIERREKEEKELRIKSEYWYYVPKHITDKLPR